MPEISPIRKLPNDSVIQGLDLTIDVQTQSICEVYNEYLSGATRSVMYILLLVSIISLIAVFNTNWKFSWTVDRINKCKKEIKEQEALLADHKLHKVNDTTVLRDSIEYLKKNEEGLIRSYIENIDTIRITFIGVVIDTNDLATISGFSLIILLSVLRFTLAREKNNLKIALNSVSERYPPDADFTLFKKMVQKQKMNTSAYDEEKWDKLISDINFLRRRYHYNFLSMNEIFNMPFLDTSENYLQKRWIGKVINKYIFYFFVIIFSLIILNDLCSVKKGFAENWGHTWVTLISSYICYVFVFDLSKKCVDQKLIIYKLFKNFWENDYKYDDNRYEPKPVSIFIIFFIASILLSLIYLLSLAIINAPLYSSA